MKTVMFDKRKFSLLLILIMLFSFGCAKKKSNTRAQAKPTAANRTTTGATANTGNVLDQNAKRQADAVALKNGITLDWAGTDDPIEGANGQNQNYIYIVNVFKINGNSYEFPTVHYTQNTAPISAETSYFTADGVDIDVDAQCYDSYCQEYLVSLKLSKESQNIQQIMLYVDFQNRVTPVISVNDMDHFLTIPQFSDILKSVF